MIKVYPEIFLSNPNTLFVSERFVSDIPTGRIFRK
jgi:hypothetical protein